MEFYPIIDAHAHLWLKQDTVVDGMEIRTTTRGRSMFMGEEVQMVPPFMVDGVNSAAVITQEFIDGIQNEYLLDAQRRYPERFLVCGMVDFRKPSFIDDAKAMIAQGFKAVKIPAQRLGW